MELVLSEINTLIHATNFWGMVNCDYGHMYLAGNDDGIAIRYLHGMGYEPKTLALWYSLCRGSDIVIDVGAHTGIFSLAAFKAGAKRVISIEPLWLNAARLMLNLRANGYPVGGVKFLAASSHRGYSELVTTTLGTKTGYCSSGATLMSSLSGIPVQTELLDALVSKDDHAKVAVVKIDVEGHVRKVLLGMSKILEHKPDLIFEASELGIDRILDPLGYHYYDIDENEGMIPVSRLTTYIKSNGDLALDRRNRYATVKQ